MRHVHPLIAALGISMSGCGLTSASSGSSSSSQCSGPEPEIGPDEAAGWGCVSASKGGRVDIPDGAWLEIPPGALDQDQRIVVTVPSPLPEYSRVYRLEPTGITFAKPVTLHSPYPLHPSGKQMPISVVISSELEPTSDVGSELTNWKYVDVTSRDETAHVLSAELEHFSVVYYFYQVDEHAYLVVDLPTRYLQAGDIVATLTNRDKTEGPNWNPGHVGMIHTISPTSNVSLVIESSPPEGVQKNDLTEFKTGYDHLYLGPRKVGGPPLTLAERQSLISFLNTQNGKPYQLLGEGNITEGAFSCVGLVEAAYDKIGRGTIPWNGEFFAITPLEMFRGSRPITDVHTRADMPVQIPIYGVTLDAKSPYIGTTMRGFYQRSYDYTITASSKPDGSTFSGTPNSGYAFEWTPTIEDGCVATAAGQPCPPAGEPHLLVLELEATPRASVDDSKIQLDPVHITETVTVHVSSHSRIFQISPASPLTTSTVTVQIPLPAGASFKATSLRDENTKAPPAPNLLPGHTVTVVSEGFSQSANAAVVTINVTNDTAGTITAAPVPLRYTLDYEVDRYLN